MKKQTFTILLGSSIAFFFLVCSWSCQKENELPEVSLFQVEVPSGALQPGEIAYVLLSGQDGEEITLETLSEGMSLDLTGRYDVAAPVCVTLFRKKPTVRGHFKAWELTTYCDLREGKLVVTPSGASLKPEVRYQFDHVNAFASADPQRETLHHPQYFTYISTSAIDSTYSCGVLTYEAPFNAHYFAFQSLNGFRYYWNPIALPGQKYQVDFSDMSELREQISLELPLMDYAHVQLYGLRDNLYTPYRVWENYSGFISPPSSFTLYYPTDLFRHFLLDLDIAVSASYNVRFVRIDAEPVDLDFAYPEWDIARPADNVFTIEGIYDAYQLEYAYILAGDPVLNWKVYGAPRPEIIPRRPKIPQDFRLTFPEEQIKLLSVGMLDLPGTDGYAAWVSAMLAKGKRRNIADSGPWLLMNRKAR